VKVMKSLAIALGVLLAALVIVPLIVLAGLFVWLKLTEESDEEALELEQELV
jgi:sensor domain CHASE-containing protein